MPYAIAEYPDQIANSRGSLYEHPCSLIFIQNISPANVSGPGGELLGQEVNSRKWRKSLSIDGESDGGLKCLPDSL